MNLDVRWSVAAKDDSIDARLVDRVLGEYPGDARARAHHRAGAPVVGVRRRDMPAYRRRPRRASRAAVVARQAPDSSGVGLRDRDEHLA